MSTETYETMPGSPARAAIPVVRGLFRALHDAGYEPYEVFCDGEVLANTNGDAEATMQHVFSVDDAAVRFRLTEGRENEGEPWVYLVLWNGNYDPHSACDVISDYSVTNGFSEAIEAFCDGYPEQASRAAADLDEALDALALVYGTLDQRWPLAQNLAPILRKHGRLT